MKRKTQFIIIYWSIHSFLFFPNKVDAQKYLENMNERINYFANIGKLDSADILNEKMFNLGKKSRNVKVKNEYFINKILIRSYRMQIDSFINYLTQINLDLLDPPDLLRFHIANSSHYYALHHTKLRIETIRKAAATIHHLTDPDEIALAMNQKLFILYYYSPTDTNKKDSIDYLLDQWLQLLPELSTLNKFRYFSKKITLPYAEIGERRLALDDMRDIVKSTNEPFYHYFYHILNYNYYYDTPAETRSKKNFNELKEAEKYLKQIELANQEEYLMKSKFEYYNYNGDYQSILNHKNKVVSKELGDADNSLISDIAHAYNQVGKQDSALLFLNECYDNYKYNSRNEDAKNQMALMNALESQRELLLEKNRVKQQRYIMVLLIIGSILTIITFQVISKEKLNHKLSDLNKELEKTNENLEDYVSLTTHDLRSPIASINNLSNPNFSTKSSEDLVKNMGLIHDISSNSLNIVSGLAMYHNLKNNIPFELKELNLQPIVNEVVEYMEPLITSKNVSLEIDINSNQKIYGNRNLLKRLFQNLIENSLKFVSEAGNRKITISSNPDGESYVMINVWDNGRGIPANKLQDIFNKRYKINSDLPGSGLGLTFCQQIVHYHNGEINVESKENEYTLVSMRLRSTS